MAQSHILYCLFNSCANQKLIQNEKFKYYLWNYLLHIQNCQSAFRERLGTCFSQIWFWAFDFIAPPVPHNILSCFCTLSPKFYAAAKSLQSCLTLCDPIDGSPPGSPIPGILQARVGCHFYNSSQNYNLSVLEIILIELNYFIFTVLFCFFFCRADIQSNIWKSEIKVILNYVIPGFSLEMCMCVQFGTACLGGCDTFSDFRGSDDKVAQVCI